MTDRDLTADFLNTVADLRTQHATLDSATAAHAWSEFLQALKRLRAHDATLTSLSVGSSDQAAAIGN